jgi:hypothetical protein
MKRKRIKISYKAFRHKKTGKFVSPAFAKRYPKTADTVTVSYWLEK